MRQASPTVAQNITPGCRCSGTDPHRRLCRHYHSHGPDGAFWAPSSGKGISGGQVSGATGAPPLAPRDGGPDALPWRACPRVTLRRARKQAGRQKTALSGDSHRVERWRILATMQHNEGMYNNTSAYVHTPGLSY